ncbi:MAG: PAS domain-containing protein [Magnetospirillum sp.]|nr:PAS domain-containing protein [Magnetospirillum sp.]
MDSEPLRHPQLISLHRWWLDQGASDGLPSAADLSPAMLRPWLDNLVVVDIPPEGEPRYSYYGANLAAAFGTDMVGRSIEQLPAAQRSILSREYDDVRTHRVAVGRRYSADFDGVPQTWERLLLPFFDGDNAVEKILVAVYRLD